MAKINIQKNWKTWWSYHDHGMIQPCQETWPPFRHHHLTITIFRQDHGMMMAKSWHGSHVFPNRDFMGNFGCIWASFSWKSKSLKLGPFTVNYWSSSKNSRFYHSRANLPLVDELHIWSLAVLRRPYFPFPHLCLTKDAPFYPWVVKPRRASKVVEPILRMPKKYCTSVKLDKSYLNLLCEN